MADVVALPCDRPEEWSETQKFIMLLSQSKCLEDFSSLISSSAGAPKGRGSVLRGFQRYVKGHCSPKERSTFFKITLPGICRLASQLPSLCPAEGIPFVKTQEGELSRPSVSCPPALTAERRARRVAVARCTLPCTYVPARSCARRQVCASCACRRCGGQQIEMCTRRTPYTFTEPACLCVCTTARSEYSLWLLSSIQKQCTETG